MPSRTYGDGPNPSGLCMCGCGEYTPIARSSDKAKGHVKGTPHKYVKGHKPNRFTRYRVDEITGCWIWTGELSTRGYGRISIAGRTRNAHVVCYEQWIGPVPCGLELDHLCRNHACVRPSHLDAVTHTVNVRRGSRAKLDMSTARDIRYRHGVGESIRNLAVRFAVSQPCIRAIVREDTWKENRI